jgi:hypothetical protein
MAVAAQNIKQMAHDVIDRLPENATWKDVSYEISILQDIEDGLADSDANRVTSNDDVRRRFGLAELAE